MVKNGFPENFRQRLEEGEGCAGSGLPGRGENRAETLASPFQDSHVDSRADMNRMPRNDCKRNIVFLLDKESEGSRAYYKRSRSCIKGVDTRCTTDCYCQAISAIYVKNI